MSMAMMLILIGRGGGSEDTTAPRNVVPYDLVQVRLLTPTLLKGRFYFVDILRRHEHNFDRDNFFVELFPIEDVL